MVVEELIDGLRKVVEAVLFCTQQHLIQILKVEALVSSSMTSLQSSSY